MSKPVERDILPAWFVQVAAEILSSEGDSVRAYVRSRVSDPDEVDEVLQVSMVIAWERLAQLRDPEHFRPWFIRICRSILSRRAAARAPGHSGDPVLALEGETITMEQAVAEQTSFDRRLWSIIRLPPQQRAVVVARLYRGLSVAETARLLRKRPGTIKATLSQAIKRLRDQDSRAVTETDTRWGQIGY